MSAQQNDELQQRIHVELLKALHQSGGILSFADFMRMALYLPDAGYYMRERSPFCGEGDFVTAPILTPLFGHTLAWPISQYLERLSDKNQAILELGAGTGALAVSLLPKLVEYLEERGQSLQHYAILELSGSRQHEQYTFLKSSLTPELFERVIWWNTLPENWSGIVIANEVLDAVPVHRVRWADGQHWELGVSYKNNCWVEQPRALDGSRSYDALLLKRAQHYLPPIDGYTSEIHLEAEGLIQSLGECIQQGFMLWIDYGFDAETYYHPERLQGTLRVHQRHKSHDAWWTNVGQVDLTAHVNFDAIAEAALDVGWGCEQYMSQASFLLDAGLLDHLRSADIPYTDYAQQVQPLHMLISPAEMGELFKVLLLSRGVANDL